MNHSRFLVGALVLWPLPLFAQDGVKPITELPYPLITLADAVRLMNIKPIKLHVRDITVKEALQEVERQTAIRIDTGLLLPVFNKKLSLDIETNSFREATNAIFDEVDADATVERYSEGARWIVRSGGGAGQERDAPASGLWPFQLRLQSLTLYTGKAVRPEPVPIRREQTTFNARLLFDCDPRLPLVETPRIVATRIEDDLGRSLRVGNDNFFGFRGSMSYTTSVQLLPPEKDAHSISHYEGKVIYLLSRQREKWEVADILNAKDATHDFQAGGDTVRVSITGAHKTDDGVKLDVTVKSLTPEGGLMASHPLLQFAQLSASIRLLDANGQTLSDGGGGGRGALRTSEWLYRLPRVVVTPLQDGQPPLATEPPILAEPLKLVIEAPTDLVRTEVPFSFSNIPLP